MKSTIRLTGTIDDLQVKETKKGNQWYSFYVLVPVTRWDSEAHEEVPCTPRKFRCSWFPMDPPDGAPFNDGDKRVVYGTLSGYSFTRNDGTIAEASSVKVDNIEAPPTRVQPAQAVQAVQAEDDDFPF